MTIVSKNMPELSKVIGNHFLLDDFIPIDLSTNNEELKLFDTSNPDKWELYITDYLRKNNAKVAYGGYLETRNLYDRSDYFQSSEVLDKRNIHLGIDFWCEAGTSVNALFDGKVHSFQNNTNYGDYGPTIITEHTIDDFHFFLLYGHLSLESISNKSVGQTIHQNEIIGHLGSSDVNGQYAPHLHFQLILNLENNFGDYPGVCSLSTLDFYKDNCPNPLLFLEKLDSML